MKTSDQYRVRDPGTPVTPKSCVSAQPYREKGGFYAGQQAAVEIKFMTDTNAKHPRPSFFRVSMTPTEARELAQRLITMAEHAEE